MILDSSAIVAMVRSEPEADVFYDRLAGHPGAIRISAANYLEAAIVLDSARDPVVGGRLDRLIKDLEVEIVAVTADHARIARQAYRDFGKGSGHPARLNFGDCFAYALARATGEPLLYKGGDFALTDIAAA